MNARRRHLPRILALTVLTASLLGAGVTPASALVDTGLAGQTRFETAVEISKECFPAGSTGVIIATGTNWPDALGGASLTAQPYLQGPILLVNQGSIPTVVWNEINRLNPTRAIILGGTNAVGPEVESQLVGKLGAGNVGRVAGVDRYETADVTAYFSILLTNGWATYHGIAFVATGGDFPDALAAGPFSSSYVTPIFLANPHTDEVSTALMKSAGVTDVVILGGPGAVSETVELKLEAEFPGRVGRLAGANRYETGVTIAEWSQAGGLTWDNCSFATGEDYPDALTGGVMGDRKGGVLFITPSDHLHGAVADKLIAQKASIGGVYYLGGTNSLSNNVRNQVRDILQ